MLLPRTEEHVGERMQLLAIQFLRGFAFELVGDLLDGVAVAQNHEVGMLAQDGTCEQDKPGPSNGVGKTRTDCRNLVVGEGYRIITQSEFLMGTEYLIMGVVCDGSGAVRVGGSARVKEFPGADEVGA